MIGNYKLKSISLFKWIIILIMTMFSYGSYSNNQNKKKYKIEPRLGYSFFTIKTNSNSDAYVNGVGNIIGLGQNYSFKKYSIFLDIESWITRFTKPSNNPNLAQNLWTSITWNGFLGAHYFLENQKKAFISLFIGYQNWIIDQKNHEWNTTSYSLSGIGGGFNLKNNKFVTQFKYAIDPQNTSSNFLIWTIGVKF